MEGRERERERERENTLLLQSSDIVLFRVVESGRNYHSMKAGLTLLFNRGFDKDVFGK